MRVYEETNGQWFRVVDGKGAPVRYQPSARGGAVALRFMSKAKAVAAMNAMACGASAREAAEIARTVG